MVDNSHALNTHEALHGFTAIKFCVNFFYLVFGGPSALGALGCSPFSPLGNPGQSQPTGDYKSFTQRQAAITFRQASGYLPSRRASPPLGWYQVILLGDRGT